MGESNNERLARKKRERAEYLKRQAEQEKADAELAARLDSDPEFAEQFDDSFVRNLHKFDDEFLDKFARDKGFSTSEAEAMKKAAHEAMKKLKGGFFSRADPAAAEAIVNNNKGLRALKKKKKGCAVIAVLLLGIGGSAISAAVYGAAEALAAVIH